MNHFFGKTIVIGLGGSVIFPDGIDCRFLKVFRKFIKNRLKGKRFIIVAGGGKISRVYQDAASSVVSVTNDDKDWLGIHATRTNAHLLRTIFADEADPVIIDSRRKIKKPRYPVTIASGWRPGWSTDYIAVALAKVFEAPEVVIAGKPAYVYDKDPQIYKNAKSFTEISWRKYRRLVPRFWAPGSHAPVDPIAARFAEKEKIAAIVINGKDARNFGKLLDGGNFEGTVIN